MLHWLHWLPALREAKIRAAQHSAAMINNYSCCAHSLPSLTQPALPITPCSGARSIETQLRRPTARIPNSAIRSSTIRASYITDLWSYTESVVQRHGRQTVSATDKLLTMCVCGGSEFFRIANTSCVMRFQQLGLRFVINDAMSAAGPGRACFTPYNHISDHC